jgi:hypothetical protein
MKTTVELPDALVKLAKQKASKKGITLQALIRIGLEKELGFIPPSKADPLDRLRTIGSELWKEVKADQYMWALREGWDKN